jgi:hypothetical protein
VPEQAAADDGKAEEEQHGHVIELSRPMHPPKVISHDPERDYENSPCKLGEKPPAADLKKGIGFPEFGYRALDIVVDCVELVHIALELQEASDD